MNIYVFLFIHIIRATKVNCKLWYKLDCGYTLANILLQTVLRAVRNHNKSTVTVNITPKYVQVCPFLFICFKEAPILCNSGHLLCLAFRNFYRLFTDKTWVSHAQNKMLYDFNEKNLISQTDKPNAEKF